MFVKYSHVEQLKNTEVEGILNGTCYIFPKLDGTNASLFLIDNRICAGSRNRQLSINDDNAGFYNTILSEIEKGQSNYAHFLVTHPHLTLYGEWLVPHVIKTYVPEAWRKFYIFDVFDRETGSFLHYDVYSELLDAHAIPYLKAQKLESPSIEVLQELVSTNTFLLQDGKGVGEGIVIKNYSFVNRYGRYAMAKMIASTEKASEHKVVKDYATTTEASIVDRFCTSTLIEKTYHKILTSCDGCWNPKTGIPRLLETVWHDFLTEEIYAVWKNNRGASIHFPTLKKLVDTKVKQVLSELFR